MIKKVAILGAGESGFGAAMLASKKGYNVFVSDLNCIDDNIKLLFEDNSIEYEEEYRSPGWDRYKKNKILKWKK